MSLRYLLPALALVALVILLAIGLRTDPRKVPSPLIGKPAPALDLAPLDVAAGAAPSARRESVRILNFWASWCTPCLEEHPLLLEKAAGGVAILGVNYKDTPEDARAWLARHGNPYARVLRDPEGQAGLDWGVYGVPETYVVDATGTIRLKHVGPLTRTVWDREIAPLLGAAR